MAKFFREEEIEEFRQCFFFHAVQDGKVTDRTPALRPGELKLAMRALGLSPTLDEVRKYIKTHGGKVTFADFLEVLYKHKQVEQIPDDILDGFRVHDVKKTNVLPEKDMRWMLQNFGERLTSFEVDQLFREGRASSYGNIQYNEFVQNVCNGRDMQNQLKNQQQPRTNVGLSNEPRPDY